MRVLWALVALMLVSCDSDEGNPVPTIWDHCCLTREPMVCSEVPVCVRWLRCEPGDTVTVETDDPCGDYVSVTYDCDVHCAND